MKRRKKKEAFQNLDQGPDPNQDLVRVVIVIGQGRGGSPARGPETGESLARGPGTDRGRATRGTDPGQDPNLGTGTATSTRRTRAGEAGTTRMSCESSKRSPGDTRNTRGPGAAPDQWRNKNQFFV